MSNYKFGSMGEIIPPFLASGRAGKNYYPSFREGRTLPNQDFRITYLNYFFMYEISKPDHENLFELLPYRSLSRNINV
jgi:hypothetical protein